MVELNYEEYNNGERSLSVNLMERPNSSNYINYRHQSSIQNDAKELEVRKNSAFSINLMDQIENQND